MNFNREIQNNDDDDYEEIDMYEHIYNKKKISQMNNNNDNIDSLFNAYLVFEENFWFNKINFHEYRQTFITKKELKNIFEEYSLNQESTMRFFNLELFSPNSNEPGEPKSNEYFQYFFIVESDQVKGDQVKGILRMTFITDDYFQNKIMNYDEKAKMKDIMRNLSIFSKFRNIALIKKKFKGPKMLF